MNNPFQPQTPVPTSPNIVLAVVSLGLGVIGLAGMLPTLIFGLCAIIPIVFGVGALITGFLGRSRAKNDPAKWGGSGLALAGIVVGAVSVVAPILFILLVIVLWAGLAGAGQLGR